MTSDANEPPATAERLILDANILIRAVLGSRVLERMTEFREDRDFFGSRVATWTTDRVRLLFEEA